MPEVGRPCKLRLQVEGGEILELENMGFHLMESPDILAPVQREYETENYPEKDGVLIYPYTTYLSFEYSCKMLYVGQLDTMNTEIRALWNMMFDVPLSGGVRRAKEVSLYNDYKNVKVVGYATEMPGEDTFVEVKKGCWMFNITLFIADPSKCVWSL